MIWLAVLAFGLLAGTIGAIVGFGGSIILLPILTLAFGAKAAVPIMGLAGILANLSRIVVWWREIDWRAALVYSAAGMPAGALGARTMLALDARVVETALGVFMLATIPARRWLRDRGFRLGLAGLAAAGLCVGFLTGIVASTGPLSTPFFLAYGLTKGGFIATEAAGSFMVYLAKTATFQALGALPWDIIAKGLIVGASMMSGAWLAKQVMTRFDARQFQGMMDAMLLAAGLFLIASAQSLI